MSELETTPVAPEVTPTSEAPAAPEVTPKAPAKGSKTKPAVVAEAGLQEVKGAMRGAITLPSGAVVSYL